MAQLMYAIRTAPALPVPAPEVVRRRPGRDAFFDNAKYLAIVLVAMGHAWEPLPGSGRIVEAVYTLVYAVHMPVFIMIAGYFSRTFDGSTAKVQRLLGGVLVPYVVFEVAYTLFQRQLRQPDFPLSLADPYWILWFLPALFLWRLSVPVWRAVRWPLPLALLVAAVASVAGGIGDDLDLGRVLQYLPYFVLGLCLRPEHIARVRDRRVRIAAVPVVAMALLVAYWAVPRMNTSWFFHRYNAQDLGMAAWTGPVMTFALFAAALVLGVCFLAWTPGRRMWFTTLGAGTLYGYLLHGFVIRGASYLGWYDHEFLATPAGRVAVSLAAAAVVTLLCTRPVRTVLRPVVEPSLDRLVRRAR
ncbi:acyltransferase family protein [Streptomyces mesophilus]